MLQKIIAKIKAGWKIFLLQALGGFIFWTTVLTPYMTAYVGVNLEQYLKWMGMQFIIIPPLAPLSIWCINRFVKLLFPKRSPTLEMVRKALWRAWDGDTCYPGSFSDWTIERPYVGQCEVTALIVNDYFGGKILKNYEFHHYWNLTANGTEIDYTKLQFKKYSEECPVINDDGWASRSYLLEGDAAEKAHTKERYEILKKRVECILNCF